MRLTIGLLATTVLMASPSMALAQASQGPATIIYPTTPGDCLNVASAGGGYISDSGTPCQGALPGAYVVTGTTDSAIHAPYTLANNLAATPANRSGASVDVYGPDALITLATPLSVVPGAQVRLHGVDPVIVPLGPSIMDGWTFAYDAGGAYAGITIGLGTVLKGSGIEGVNGNTTPISSGSATYTNWLVNEGVDHVGFDGFTNAIHFGATNSQGMGGGHVTYNWFQGFSGAAILNENMAQNVFEHNRIKVTVSGANGEVHEADDNTSGGGYQPGNFYMADEFVTGAPTAGGFAYEFLATNTSTLSVGGGVGRIQANGNTTPVTTSVTPASSSTAVAVTDLTKFFAGQFVNAGTTADGYTSGREYVVQTVSGASGAGSITIGNCINTTACPPIAASASTAINLTYAGQPNIAAIAGQGSVISQLDLGMLDLENSGAGNVSIYGEKLVNSYFQAASQEGSIVLRNGSTYNHFLSSANNSNYDADASSSIDFPPEYSNTIGQSTGMGVRYDNTLQTGCLNLNSYSTGNSCDFSYSYFSGGAHLLFNTPFGQASDGYAVSSCGSSGSPTTISGYGGLVYVGYGGPGCYFKLLTITVSTGHDGRGLPLWIINPTSYPITIETDGTQVFNNISGMTSVIVPPGQSLHIQSTNGYGGSGELAYTWELEMPGALVTSASGIYQTGAHIVNTTATLASGTVTITLSNGAAFTSATSYSCAVNDNTTPSLSVGAYVTKASGTSLTVTETGGTADSVGVSCWGN